MAGEIRPGPLGVGSDRQQTNDGLTEEDYAKLIGDPTFNRVFSKLFKDHLVNGEVEDLVKKVVVQEKQPEPETSKSAGKQIMGGKDKIVSKNVSNREMAKISSKPEVVKSPSNTTLYTPALNKVRENNAIQKISNFIEAVRLESQADSPMSNLQHSNGAVDPSNIPGHDRAKNKTKQAVLEAEKFRAKIVEPTGRIHNITNNDFNSQSEMFAMLQDDPNVEEVNNNNSFLANQLKAIDQEKNDWVRLVR